MSGLCDVSLVSNFTLLYFKRYIIRICFKHTRYVLFVYDIYNLHFLMDFFFASVV